MTCEEFIKNVTYSYQDIPVCILSGNKLNSNMQQFMNLGVIQYIDKEDVIIINGGGILEISICLMKI